MVFFKLLIFEVLGHHFHAFPYYTPKRVVRGIWVFIDYEIMSFFFWDTTHSTSADCGSSILLAWLTLRVGSQNPPPSNFFPPHGAGRCLCWRQSCDRLPHHHGNTESCLLTGKHAVKHSVLCSMIIYEKVIQSLSSCEHVPWLSHREKRASWPCLGGRGCPPSGEFYEQRWAAAHCPSPSRTHSLLVLEMLPETSGDERSRPWTSVALGGGGRRCCCWSELWRHTVLRFW